MLVPGHTLRWVWLDLTCAVSVLAAPEGRVQAGAGVPLGAGFTCAASAPLPNVLDCSDFTSFPYA